MITSLFLLITNQSFAQHENVGSVQFSNKMIIELVEELKNIIDLNYLEIDKIPGILNQLDQLKDDRAFANVKSLQGFTKFINKVLQKNDLHFSVSVIPITQSNWESVGVQPHLYTELKDAEQQATKLLTRKLTKY